MAEINFTDADFQEKVIKSAKPVLVDFFADWCGPCKMLAPVIEEIAKEYEGKWIVGKCNVDENPNTSSQYGIQSIPALLLFKDGKVIDKILGFQGKENLVKKLEKIGAI